MIHASLFSGIGGFDLAAEWCGWENSFQCEINPFCQQVLAKNFPSADRHTDIKGFDATRYRGTVDVLSGGFPCQPFSLAGQRKGNSDDRALWPEMLRIIDEVRPRWIVGENVAGLASLGLDGVLFDLEASGYACETVLLPACGVSAPHRRDRLWIIAHALNTGRQNRWPEGNSSMESGRIDRRAPGHHIPAPPESGSLLFGGRVTAHASSTVCQRPAGRGFSVDNESGAPTTGGAWRLTEPPLCGPNDGLPPGLVRVSTRAKQLKAYGNSIVPQVAYELFQAIQAVDNA